MRRLRMRSDFVDTVARTGLSMKEFADTAGVNRTTIYALLKPELHPHRKGGMQRATAWRLAKAYASAAGVDEDAAFGRLFVEEPLEQVVA